MGCYNSLTNLRCSSFSPLGEKYFWIGTVGLNNKLWIFFLQLILKWISKYSCPALALAAIVGKDKACSGGNNGGTTLQNKAWSPSVAAGANVTADCFTTHKLYVHIMMWEYEPIRQFKLSVLLCILCKCNCRRLSSHCITVTQFAPQKYVSLITDKFPKEEEGQWPTSVTHFAELTYLRPRTRLFQSPT